MKIGKPVSPKKPEWLRKKLPLSHTVSIKRSLREKKLHTVCESARCPNIGECFSMGTATLMILGGTCGRGCRFCGVDKGSPLPPDPDEPRNCALMVRELRLRHAVITSVTRDDLPDGGASHYVEVVKAVREMNPDTAVELLIPDFDGDHDALSSVFGIRPDILNHNIETVPSLYPTIRPQASYRRSLGILRDAAQCNIPVKSGIMVGLGETEFELLETINDIVEHGVNILTIGQYLPPSRRHHPVLEYYGEERFAMLEQAAKNAGIGKVFAGPFVRSSYMAEKVYRP